MLIGIDASSANKKQKTGIEWYCYNLIEALKNNDKKISIFYTPPPN